MSETDTLTAIVSLDNGEKTNRISVNLTTPESQSSGPAGGRDYTDCWGQPTIQVSTYMKGQEPDRPLRSYLTFFVKTLRAKETLTFHEPLTMFIQDLKKKLTEKISLNESNYWLDYGGSPLEDGRRLCDYRIQNNSTIFMKCRVRGG